MFSTDNHYSIPLYDLLPSFIIEEIKTNSDDETKIENNEKSNLNLNRNSLINGLSFERIKKNSENNIANLVDNEEKTTNKLSVYEDHHCILNQ